MTTDSRTQEGTERGAEERVVDAIVAQTPVRVEMTADDALLLLDVCRAAAAQADATAMNRISIPMRTVEAGIVAYRQEVAALQQKAQVERTFEPPSQADAEANAKEDAQEEDAPLVAPEV